MASDVITMDKAIKRIHRMTREQDFIGASDRKRLLLAVMQQAQNALSSTVVRKE